MKKIFLLFIIIFMSLYILTLKRGPLDVFLYKKIIAVIFITLIIIGLLSNVRLKISEPFYPQTPYLSLSPKDFKLALKEMNVSQSNSWNSHSSFKHRSPRFASTEGPFASVSSQDRYFTEKGGVYYGYSKIPTGIAEKKLLHVSWIDPNDVKQYCDTSDVGEKKTKKEDKEEDDNEEKKSSEGFIGKKFQKKVKKQLKKQIVKPMTGIIRKIKKYLENFI